MSRSKSQARKEILYVTAFDKNKALVKAKDAEKTEEYYCPECNEKLILKKSGKTGKGSKRPHFAHYAESPNCTPEGVLHKSFKLLLLEKIKKHIAEKKPIDIEWECIYCHEKHNGNLIYFATDAKEEYQMENCRADIVLLQGDDPIAVIEIIVTHKPEETAIEYYKNNKIVLIQIELENDDDLEKIDAKINKPTSIDYCFNLNCPNLDDYAYLKHPEFYRKTCGFFHPFLSFTVVVQHFFGLYRSKDFTKDEIKLAESKGVMFEGKNVTCPQCRYMRARGARRF